MADGAIMNGMTRLARCCRPPHRKLADQQSTLCMADIGQLSKRRDCRAIEDGQGGGTKRFLRLSAHRLGDDGTRAAFCNGSVKTPAIVSPALLPSARLAVVAARMIRFLARFGPSWIGS